MTSNLEQFLFARYKEHVLAGRMTAQQSFWLLLLMDELSVNPDGAFGDEVDRVLHHERIGRRCIQDMSVREASLRLGIPKSTLHEQMREALPSRYVRVILPTVRYPISADRVIDIENPDSLGQIPAPGPLEVSKDRTDLSGP